MRAKNIRLKAPRLWDIVEESVYQDLLLELDVNNLKIKDKLAKTIAHNAAFMAVAGLLTLLTRK